MPGEKQAKTTAPPTASLPAPPPELPDDAPPDEAFGDAFDEATAPETAKDAGDKAPSPDAAAEESQDAAGTAPVEPSLTAPADKAPAAEQKPAAAPAETKPPEAQAPAKPPEPAPGQERQDFLAAALDKVAAEDTPPTISMRGRDVPVAQFLKDFPEVAAVATHIARRMVQEALAPVAAMVPSMRDLAYRQQRDQFFDTVARDVPEARTIAASPEFQTWLAGQPRPVQALASQDDPEAAVYVLKQYTATQPAPKPTARSPAPSPEFERRRQALTGALTPKPTPRKAGGPDPDDFDAAFEEAVAEADQNRRRR